MHVLEQMDFESENLHLEIVQRTLHKWLPVVLPASPPRGIDAPSFAIEF